MAFVVARITAFGDSDPRRRSDTRGEIQVFSSHLELRRELQRDGSPLVRCGVFLDESARAQLANELLLSLPVLFLAERLGVDDGAVELVRLLRRLVDPGDSR